MVSAVPEENRIEMKESKKIDKYLDFTREIRKLWNKRMTVIPIVVRALEE